MATHRASTCSAPQNRSPHNDPGYAAQTGTRVHVGLPVPFIQQSSTRIGLLYRYRGTLTGYYRALSIRPRRQFPTKCDRYQVRSGYVLLHITRPYPLRYIRQTVLAQWVIGYLKYSTYVE